MHLEKDPDFIWRFQTRSGVGPYIVTPRGAFRDEHYDGRTHPNPSEELLESSDHEFFSEWGGDRSMWEYIVAHGWQREIFLFGHNSIAQARRWWSKEDIEELEQYDCRLTAWRRSDCRIVVDGKHQCMFVPAAQAGNVRLGDFRLPERRALPPLDLAAHCLRTMSVERLRALAASQAPASD